MLKVMLYTVYIIQSLKNRMRYIGQTINLTKRLEEHNRGRNKSTRNKGPWRLIYKEEGFSTVKEALKREREIKKMKGGIQFKKLLEKQF